MYEIEDGVPLPSRRASNRKYPFDELEIGQSFFVPDKTPQDIAGSWSRATKVLQRKFTARTVDGGVRVWRVE